jgi:hypothetical protein
LADLASAAGLAEANLPTAATPTPAQPTYLGQELRLPRVLDQRLRAFARRHRLTLFTLFEAGWARTIAAMTGRGTVAFGTVSSGRSPEVPDIDRVVGPLNNILPVVLHPPDAEHERDRLGWLHDLQRDHAAAREHDHVSLADLRHWIGCPAGQDLVDTFIVFENFPRRSTMEEQFAVWGPDGGETQTEHLMRLLIWPSSPVGVVASYYPDQIAPDAVRTVLDRYLAELDSLVAPVWGNGD